MEYSKTQIIFLFVVLGLIVSGFTVGLINYLEFHEDTIDLGNRNIITNGIIKSRDRVEAGTATGTLTNDGVETDNMKLTGDGLNLDDKVEIKSTGEITVAEGQTLTLPKIVDVQQEVRFINDSNFHFLLKCFDYLALFFFRSSKNALKITFVTIKN